MLGPIAQSHYDSFMLTLWVTALLCITVGGPFVYALFAFKEKKGFDPKKDKLPEQTHGNTKVEVSLIFYSIILLFIISFLPFGKEQIPSLEGIAYFFEGKSKKHKITLPEKDPFTINVTGHQWWFSFHYPNHGVVTSNEMVFPINTPIKINLISADVIHSFWLPKIAGKVDLMPGQTNSMWLYTENEDNFSGQCAEYCGDSHAYMLFRGIATTQEKFDKWVERQKQTPKIEYTNSDGDTYSSWAEVRKAQSENKETEAAVVKTKISYPKLKEDTENPTYTLSEMEALGERLFNGDPNTVPEQLREAGHTTNAIACVECHSLNAIPTPDWTKPSLLHFAERTTIGAGWRDMNKEEIKEWVQQPGKVKPGNRMWKEFAKRYKIIDENTTQDLWNRKKTEANAYHSFFTDEEAEAIAEFLLTLKHPEATDWNELYGKPIKARKKEPTPQDPKQVKASEKSNKDKLAKN